MKKITSSILLATAVIMALSACGEKEQKKNTVVIEASEHMQATELADAGEQLVTPYTFMLADKVFDQALTKDPQNIKAQFYKNFLKRIMIFKGIYTRVAPLVRQKGNIVDHNNVIKNMPNAPLKSFLTEGKEDIKTAVDLQNMVAQYQTALSDFRNFLREHADAEFSINMNPYIFEQEIKNEWGKSCVVKKNTESNVEVECDLTDTATKKVNAADLMILRQYTAMELFAFTIYNSYSLEGYDKIAQESRGKDLSSEEQWNLINKSENILTLRKGNRMAQLKDIAVDVSSAIKWAAKYQDRLCPKGGSVAGQRKGFLFSEGLCLVLNTEQKEHLAWLDSAIAGPVTSEIQTAAGKVPFKIDYFAWSKNPPKDLRKLLPVNRKYSCNEKLELQDKSFGGIFVNSDADKLEPVYGCESK